MVIFLGEAVGRQGHLTSSAFSLEALSYSPSVPILTPSGLVGEQKGARSSPCQVVVLKT